MDPIVFPVTAARQKWPQSQLFKSQVSKHDEGQQYHLETPPPTHHSKDFVTFDERPVFKLFGPDTWRSELPNITFLWFIEEYLV